MTAFTAGVFCMYLALHLSTSRYVSDADDIQHASIPDIATFQNVIAAYGALLFIRMAVFIVACFAASNIVWLRFSASGTRITPVPAPKRA